MKKFYPVILLLAAMTLFLLYTKNDPQNITEGITRAQAARMLAWCVYDMNENGSKSAGPLIDVDNHLWYADEISVVLTHGLMKKDGDLFHPVDYLTWKEASDIATLLEIPLKIPLFHRAKPIPLEKWLLFFDAWLSKNGKNITCQLKIENIPSTSDTLDKWEVQTNQGIYHCEGLSLEKYLGQTVLAYTQDHELLMVSNFHHPEILTAATSTEQPPSETSSTSEIPDENKRLQQSGLSSEPIRVCLMNNGFTSEKHEKISLTSDIDWQVIFKDKTVQYLADQTAELTADQFEEEGDSAEIRTENDHGMTVLSLTRNCGHPSYRGILRIIKTGNELYLVNILPMDTYLEGVIPSEMPAYYQQEALKAQAVCARSYAANALQHPKYPFADLNDSTSCQVYMNQLTDDRSDQAVLATRHEVLFYQQQIVTAKYFSSSCGSLSGSDVIWPDPDSNNKNTYMLSRLETEPPTIPNLETEKAFIDFIQHPEPDMYVEQNDPWFRWYTKLPLSVLHENIARLFTIKMHAAPEQFTILSPDGTIHADNIGQIQVIQRADSGVLQKIKLSGENQELTINGEYQIRSLLVPSETEPVILQDGSSREGLSLLPSGYFYLEPVIENGETTGYELYGGGFGHGAGLSQNGANVLAEKGYDYQKILQYYFEGIDIQPVNTLK